MRIALEVNGRKELTRKLELLNDVVAEEALLEGANAAAQVVLEAARAKAPVRTGTLRDSLVAEIIRQDRDTASVAVGPGPEGFYGRFLELGTSKMPAQPWLRPAMDESEARAKRAARHAIRKTIEGAVR